MKAFLFVNGEIKNYEYVRKMIKPGDLFVAVDGGIQHMQQLDLKPAVLIGDMDSILPDQQAALEAAGIPAYKYPVHKNKTDLEIALDLILEKEIRHIRIIAGIGNRLDHTLGNIFLLTREDLFDIDIRIDDGSQELFIIHNSASIEGRQGDILSLLPLGEPVIGVITRDLKYPLNNETLMPDQTRGISNVFLKKNVSVHISQGLLICIHTRLTEDIIK